MKLNISLDDDLGKYISAKVESGTHHSSQEVVEEALRLLQEQDVYLAQDEDDLRAAWNAGEESADYAPLNVDDVAAEGHARLSRRA